MSKHSSKTFYVFQSLNLYLYLFEAVENLRGFSFLGVCWQGSIVFYDWNFQEEMFLFNIYVICER